MANYCGVAGSVYTWSLEQCPCIPLCKLLLSIHAEATTELQALLWAGIIEGGEVSQFVTPEIIIHKKSRGICFALASRVPAATLHTQLSGHVFSQVDLHSAKHVTNGTFLKPYYSLHLWWIFLVPSCLLQAVFGRCSMLAPVRWLTGWDSRLLLLPLWYCWLWTQPEGIWCGLRSSWNDTDSWWAKLKACSLDWSVKEDNSNLPRWRFKQRENASGYTSL